MNGSFRVVVHGERAEAAMRKLAAELTVAKTKPVIAGVAWRVHARLVRNTPIKWTGNLRRSWTVVETPTGFVVTNPNRVMLFLEKGTRAHGPRFKKFLYIPLVPSAMVWHPGLIRGQDYVLTKRVRGIRARNIVRDERPTARAEMLAALTRYVDNVLNKP